jgi:hypothetical protein
MTMMKRVGAVLVVGYAVAASLAVRGQQADGPRYTAGNSLVRPTNYREWPFIGSGLGLTYEEGDTTSPQFTNAFVNPSSYRHFMQTGTWPDGTVIVLEFRRSEIEAPPNRTGRFQGQLQLLEAEVKDSRFADGWAFFSFGPGTALADAAAPLAGRAVAPCVECHTRHAAVERTFVQFYPTLLEVARQKGTLKPGFR